MWGRLWPDGACTGVGRGAEGKCEGLLFACPEKVERLGFV